MKNYVSKEEAHRITEVLKKAAKEYPEITIVVDAYIQSSKRMQVMDQAFKMACEKLHEHCIESSSCIYDCPFENSEICKRVPSSVDFGSYFFEEAFKIVFGGKSEDEEDV